MTQLSQGEGALSAAAGRVSAARTDVTRLQGQLASDIGSLRGRWSGAGAVAFHRLHDAWQERQARITAALDGFEAALRETEHDTLRTDAQQADGFAHYATRLG